MHRLALHQLSLRDVSPADLPGISRQVGVDTVSVFVQPPSPDLDIFPRIEAGQGLRAFRSACATHEVDVHNVEVFSIGPDTRIWDVERSLDLAAEIGARRLTALHQDTDPGRGATQMAELAELASGRGIAVSIEFMKFSELRSIEAGAAFVNAVGHANLSLLVDPLHLFRTGGDVGSLAATDELLIGAAQICDGPLAAPASLFGEAVENRGIPGEGEFPLSDFLAHLPTDCPLDIEVPLKRLAHAGVSPVERAQRLVNATQRLLEKTAAA